MKIHQFKCNICSLIFGSDSAGHGLTLAFDKLLDPHKTDIHICNICLRKLTELLLEIHKGEES